MFEPVRGGTRGGQAEFKWADVSADKDRENYLGHSINAPTGRWQKNKDIHWYNREVKQTDAERAEEIRKIKEAEAEAIAAALGFGGPKGPSLPSSSAPGTGANSITVPEKERPASAADLEKEERKRRKAEKKEEKRVRKEQKKVERALRHQDRGRSREHGSDTDDERALSRRRGDRDRSRSPRRDRSRSLSPSSRLDRERGGYGRRYDRRDRTPPRAKDLSEDFGEREREREREMDRRRWEGNARREQPGTRWGRR